MLKEIPISSYGKLKHTHIHREIYKSKKRRLRTTSAGALNVDRGASACIKMCRIFQYEKPSKVKLY